MKLQLYFHHECGFSRSVLNTINNLKIQDKIELKNIRENPEFEKTLIEIMGDKQVPTLIVDEKPMRESEDIKKFLIKSFL
ncbi:MAG: glutaredoxin [Deltaproteobacteria bacterium]|nr:glutaredoxin [Deltaproteobacteria bacterium]